MGIFCVLFRGGMGVNLEGHAAISVGAFITLWPLERTLGSNHQSVFMSCVSQSSNVASEIMRLDAGDHVVVVSLAF